jgi:hypothetical protein
MDARYHPASTDAASADPATLVSFEKDVLSFEGPRALAPGAPLSVIVPRDDGAAITLEGRSLGSRKPRGTERFEIRARLVSLRRPDREWLERTLGPRRQ